MDPVIVRTLPMSCTTVSRVKRDELRAYRVLFHPGSRSHKVLLENFVLLGS